MNLFLSSIFLLATGFGLVVATQDAKTAPSSGTTTSQDPTQPGPQHAMLMKTAGEWDAVVIFADENGAEKRTKGSLTRRKHTAFHLVDDYQGEFMGEAFTGHGIHGYCPVKQEFYTLWVDSGLPSAMTISGDYDEKKKEVTMHGEAIGMSGKFEKCRTVSHFADDDHMSWEMYGPGPDGKEIKFLRIEYTRR